MHLLFPFLQHYCIMPHDRRYQRNVARFKAVIQNMINEKLVELEDPSNESARSTMLGMMLESDYFKHDHA